MADSKENPTEVLTETSIGQLPDNVVCLSAGVDKCARVEICG